MSLPANNNQEMRVLLMDDRVQALLAVIRSTEHHDMPDARNDLRVYRRQVGGKILSPAVLLFDKPRDVVQLNPRLASSAFGAYQFINATWDQCSMDLGLVRCDVLSQDLAAVWLINRRGAVKPLQTGLFELAVRMLGKEWASLPGSPYGQPTRPMDYCRKIYDLALAGR